MKTKIRTRNNKKTAICISIIALVITVVITICAVHSNQPALLDTDKDVANGIDISSHNKKVDWDKLTDEIDFAIIRVGYRGYGNGDIAVDEKAKYNIKHATGNDIPVGVYFYSQAITTDEAVEEAKLALKVIKSLDISLPVFIDFEYAYDGGKLTGRLYNAKLSNEKSTDIINAFCSTITDNGYTAGVYASSYMLNERLNVDDFDKKAVIWVADYNNSVTYDGKFDIWQYTNVGIMKEVQSKFVDKNYWYIKK